MHRSGVVAAAVVLTVLPLQTDSASQARTDPFAFFRPSIAVTAEDRGRLDRGETVARALPGVDHQVAVFAAVSVSIDGDRLVAWTRNIVELKKSPYVLAIRRFSDPPAMSDLAGLTLDEADLSAIHECRPQDCDVKLTAEEITELGGTAAAGSAWRPAVQEGFRRLVLRRVRSYLDGGHAALGRYSVDDRPVSLDERFSSLLTRWSFLSARVPRFTEYLDRYPGGPDVGAESFVYWSKERLTRKSVVSATHVNILRGTSAGQPDVLIAGKQIFATRYMNGSLGITALVRDEADGRRYFVYLNRSDIGLPGGVLGGVARWFVERRLRSEASSVLDGLRHRLENDGR